MFSQAVSMTFQVPRPCPRAVLALRVDKPDESFALCAWSLERFTDLSRFSQVYILADGTLPDRAGLLDKLASRLGGAEIIRCGAGSTPDFSRVVFEIAQDHSDDVIVRLDDDIVVTPGWLERLLTTYQAHARRPSVPVVSPLMPDSPGGRRLLAGFLVRRYPSLWRDIAADEGEPYRAWVWDKVLAGDFLKVYRNFPKLPHAYGDNVGGCYLFDRRLSDLVMPLPAKPSRSRVSSDGKAAVQALRRHGFMSAVAMDAVVLRLGRVPSGRSGQSTGAGPSADQVRQFLRSQTPPLT